MTRRRMWKFLYNNNPQIETSFIAQNLMREKQKFTLKRAESISLELIARFTTSWKNVFNKVGALPSDGEELMRQCKADLENWNVTQSELIGALNGLPFCHFVEEFRTIVLEWKKIAMPQLSSIKSFLKRVKQRRLLINSKKLKTSMKDV